MSTQITNSPTDVDLTQELTKLLVEVTEAKKKPLMGSPFLAMAGIAAAAGAVTYVWIKYGK